MDVIYYDEVGIPYEDEETGEEAIFFHGKHITKSELSSGTLITVFAIVLVVTIVVTALIVRIVKKKRGIN